MRCAAASLSAGLAAYAITSMLLPKQASAKETKFVSPEILVLGDSQLSFGSGKLMLDFFENFDRHCKRFVNDPATLKRVSGMRTSMFGTRSTSLQSWVSTKGPAWRRMCEKDKTWGVNASVWGHNSTPKRLYYQIGEGKKYQFCRKGKTPLQAMLRDGYYTPDLLFFYLIGNGAGRLAKNPDAATSDVKRLVAQLPPDQKCIFMTTAPIHTPRRNRVRMKAETNLRKAFAAHGNRCTFVAALTPRSVAFIQGKRKYFRQNKRGKVKDPFHPDAQATRKFLSVIKPKMCRAVAKELGMQPMASSDVTSPSHLNQRMPSQSPVSANQTAHRAGPR